MQNLDMKHTEITLNLAERHAMAILNVTPDSFYARSRTSDLSSIDERIRTVVDQGCSIIDVGGYSSRSGADDVSDAEELRRVRLGVAAVRRVAPDMTVSVDTFRGGVARPIIEEFGAVIINDISAGEIDPSIIDVAAEFDVPYIAMHMRGTPQSMQHLTAYRDIVDDVSSYFTSKCEELERRGVHRIILDPGFGFAKSLEQNYKLMRGLNCICSMGYPVLSGVSRKSMIYKLLDITPDDALAGTVALGWESLRQGATILRVHDVREAVDTIRIFNEYIR